MAVGRRGTVLLGTGAAVVLLGAAALATGAIRPFEATAGRAPAFVDETASAGIDLTYDGGFEHAAGGGVAAFDCDADGDQDLYLAGGSNPAQLYRNDSDPGGALRFRRLASPVTDLPGVNGAYPIRIRAGGEGLDLPAERGADLVVLRLGRNVVLENRGACTFEETTDDLGIDGGQENTEALSATWLGDDALPTLAFGNYLEPGNTDPDTRCQSNRLLLPDGSGSGQAYMAPVRLDPSFCTLSMLFSDWSGSGRRDLRVSNDRAYYRQDVGSEQLWAVARGTPPRLYTAADGWATVRVEGMGIGSFDLTGDGLPEVYLTSQAASKLQTLEGGADRPAYVDIGLARNANVAHPFTGADMDLPSTAWHPEFADVNNDGLMDLFISKGNTTAVPDYAMEDPSNLLLGQPDGAFTEAADAAGILTFDRGRGAALVDFNGDGSLDLIESFYGAPVRLWRNAGAVDGRDPSGMRWLAFQLRQSGANVDAIGARVDIRSGSWHQTRELVIGGGHAGGQLGWIHVGLGAADRAEIKVRWPDGAVTEWQPIPVNAFAVIDRTTGIVASSPR